MKYRIMSKNSTVSTEIGCDKEKKSAVDIK